MGETTGISWCHHTGNFWEGCDKKSPACKFCYAEFATPVRTLRAKGLEVWGPPTTTARYRTKGAWTDVPRWNRKAVEAGERRRLFVMSLGDIFEDHPQVEPWRAEALALLEKCTALDVMLLTKRPELVREMVPPAWLDRWPAHVWMGATVEDRKRATERLPMLRAIPAPVRFVSIEPQLEALDDIDLTGIALAIVGGESGPDARVFRVEWARAIVAAARGVGCAPFVKQMGDRPHTGWPPGEEWPSHVALKVAGDVFRVCGLGHHGADPAEWPRDLRVQEMPRTPGIVAGELPGLGGGVA